MTEIRSMSEVELENAVARLRAAYRDPIDASQARGILSECISELGGLFALPSTDTTERAHHFFRARRAATFIDEDNLYLPSQYSYVRRDSCIGSGRCHLPNHPVFYASNNFETAVKETSEDERELILVSFWVSRPTKVRYLKFLCPSDAAGYVAHQRDEIVKSIHDAYSHYDEFNLNRIRAHCTAWSDLFLGDESNYPISASIAHSVLYGGYPDGAIDALVYGSVVDGQYANYALHPDFADTLQLYRVYAVTHAGPNYFLFSKCTDTDLSTGRLTWRDIREEDYPANDPNIAGKPMLDSPSNSS